MEGVLQKFQDLKIQLEEITSATNNFDDQSRIGVGGFGSVYKGEVSHSKGRSMVAIKRLDRRHGQGEAEFLKEIYTLSRYRHENLISLLGFCYQGDEAIFVYELASRGSLDRHLNSPDLTWSKRIKICLDAAKGLRYLHDPRGTHQRLIHCDVKGGNVLLDDNWNAKVADFGFSILGPANEQQSTVITLAAGTIGYIDPLYRMTNTLTKESDVYSFGVVMFEVLCGRLSCTYSNDHVLQNLVPVWIESYIQKKLNIIIFKSPDIQPLHLGALEIFSDIAYRCLKESREDRPKMAEVVTSLEFALAIHKLWEGKLSTPPRDSSSKANLCEGVLLDDGKTYLSLNKKGEYCEMISIAECLGSDAVRYKFSHEYNSRFAVGTYNFNEWGDKILKAHVKPRFLSPGITYSVNLVFKLENPDMEERCVYLCFEYKLQGETENSISHLAYKRKDGWWMCELYQITTDHTTVDLQIMADGFTSFYTNYIEIDGIEFRPMEKVEHKDENQFISDSDLNSEANWEEKMPSDYEDIMKRSEDSLQWTTKEEAYSILRKGFLISDYKTNQHIWFYLDKNGKKCHLLTSTDACFSVYLSDWEVIPIPESRFGKAFQCDSSEIKIWTEDFQSQLVSSETTYACYLVYKLPEDQSDFQAPLRVHDTQCNSGDNNSYIYLVSPQTPVIKPKAGQNTRNPANNLMTKGLPQQRNDGWMEVQIWELRAATSIKIDLRLIHNEKNFSGLISEGIEFRPI